MEYKEEEQEDEQGDERRRRTLGGHQTSQPRQLPADRGGGGGGGDKSIKSLCDKTPGLRVVMPQREQLPRLCISLSLGEPLSYEPDDGNTSPDTNIALPPHAPGDTNQRLTAATTVNPVLLLRALPRQ